MKKSFAFAALLFLSACSIFQSTKPKTPQEIAVRNAWVKELNQYAIDLRYVYGKRTGWIDFSHVFPYGSEVKKWTAINLWQQFETEDGSSNPDFWQRGMIFRNICDSRFTDLSPKKYFAVSYEQAMGVYGQNFASTYRTYVVKKGLSRHLKEQVAYSIFMDVSYAFERQQGMIPYSIGIGNAASSFSTEDLPSNVLGFFAATRGGAKDKYDVWKYIKENAELVPASEAKKLMKKGFKKDKNKKPQPILYHGGPHNYLPIFDTPTLAEGKYYINIDNIKTCGGLESGPRVILD